MDPNSFQHDRGLKKIQGKYSPASIFFITIFGIAFAEVIAMIVVYFYRDLPYPVQVLLDAAVMTVIIYPILYFLSFRPLLRHIEERWRAEKQLQEMALFPALNPDPVLQVDATGRIRKCNPVAEQMGFAVDAQLFELVPDLHNLNLSECIAFGSTLQVYEARLGTRVLQWRIRGDAELGFAFLYSQDITERKRGEEAIKLLSSIVEQTADTVVVTDRNGVIEYVNPAVEDATGYNREEIIGSTPRVFKSGVHNEPFYRELWDTILQGEVFHGEITNRTKNGELFHEVKTVTPLRDAQGNITHFVATGKDITERKETEEKLRRAYDELELRVQERTGELVETNAALLKEIQERAMIQHALERSRLELRNSEEKAQNLVKYAPTAIYEMDVHGQRFLSINDVACQWSGYERDDMLCMSPLDFMDEDGKTKFAERIKAILNGEIIDEPIEYNIIARSGRKITAEMQVGALTHEDGMPGSVLVVAHDISERKQAEDALRESEARLRRSQEISHLGSWELDLVNNRLTWSDEVYRIFGLQPQQFGATYEAFLEAVHPDDRGAVDEAYSASVREGRDSYEIEHRVVRHPHGEVRIVHEKCDHFRNNAGQIVRSVGMVHDITERKLAEEQLARSNQKLNEILASIQDDLYVLDRDWNFVYASKLFTQKLGKEPEEFVGKNIWEMFPKHVGTILEENFRAAMEKREVRRFELDGKYTSAWYRMTAFPSAEGITVLGTDVTERKQAEEALQKNEAMLRTVLDQMPSGVAVRDAVTGALILSNRRSYEILGDLVNTVDQLSEYHGLHPDGSLYKSEEWPVFRSIATGEKIDSEEIELVRNQGLRSTLSISSAPIRDAHGQIVSGVSVFHDMTERKKAERELQQLNRNLQALSASNQAMMRAEDEAELLNEVCKIVVDVCGYAMVWIGYAEDDEEKTVRPVASAGFEEGYLETLHVTWADTERGRGPTGTAIRTGRPSSCRNMLTDPLFAPWRDQAIRRGYASSIVLPLLVAERTLGALTIYSRKPDAFSPDEENLLNELARDLAHGVEMIRLREAHERATTALRESEEQFFKIFHYSPVGINIFRLSDGRSVDVNDAFMELTGYSREEFVGHSGLELNLFYNPEERADWMQRLQEQGVVRNIDTQICKKSGQIASVLFSIVQLEIHHEMMGLVIVVDVTERRMAEEALRRAHDELELRVQERTKELSDEIAERKEIERQLRIETTALEAAADGVIITDTAGTILWANPAFLTMSGYSMDEIVGSNPNILASGRQDKAYYQDLWRTILSGNTWRGETINRRKDGSLYVEEQTITPVRLESDQISHFIAIKQDVSERKRAEDALRESEQKFRTLVDWTYDWEIWLDPKGNIIYNSPSCERITGHGPEEFAAEPDLMTRIIHPEDCSLYDAHQKLLHGLSAGMEKIEYRVVSRNGRERWIEHVCRPLFGADNVYLGRRISNRDITEQKEIEENIRQRNLKEKQLMQTIHTMQLDIARDLHDTIGQNIGYLRMKLDHMVEKDLSVKGADLKAEFSQMSHVANESYDLVRGTLAILQSQGPDDLLQLFKRYAGQVVERSAVKIEFNEQGMAEFITIHQMRQLFYIFREALSNIEKHSGASHAWVDMKWSSERVVLSIRDDGKGFDLAQDTTSHYGLRFMKERTEMLKGSFQVKTEPWAGTQIIIGVPLQRNGSEN